MSQNVEARVRTIVARTLHLIPEEVRPESMLFAGLVRFGGLRHIATNVERVFGITFPAGASDCWTSVADVVIATEAALAARRPRPVAAEQAA